MTPETPLQRVFFALPVLFAALAVGLATKTSEVTVALVGAVVACALVGPRVTLTTESQHVTAGVTLVPALALVQVIPDDREVLRMSGTWATLATWAVMAAASRLVMVAPAWGVRTSIGFGSLAVLLAAWLHVTPAYGALAWGFVASCVLAARAVDPHRASTGRLSGRERSIAAGVVAGALAAATLSAVVIPRMHAWMMRRSMRSTIDVTTSGFNPWLELGESQSIVLSEELVLRVYGPAPDHLRGIVYDLYDSGRWRVSRLHVASPARVPLGPIEGRDAVTVERVGSSIAWYFLPLDARQFAAETSLVRRDSTGAVRSMPGESWTTAWYRIGPRDALRVGEPTVNDLNVPDNLRARLRPIVERWVSPGLSPEARMDAIALHLEREFRYALRFSRTPRVDPVVDFLTRHRQGHCEYFASALALLGRVAGVPTRVIGGYRVGERNPIGGYRVVREKNAHAWVEAWVGGQWQTYDATPSGATPQNEAHDSKWARALEDTLARGYRRALAWATGQGSVTLLVVAGVLLVGWLSWRILRSRKPRAEAVADILAGDTPLECLAVLNDALAARGVVRETGETLERFAARVEQQPEIPTTSAHEVARLLRDYAALRYGSVGDESALARAMLAQARELTPRASP